MKAVFEPKASASSPILIGRVRSGSWPSCAVSVSARDQALSGVSRRWPSAVEVIMDCFTPTDRRIQTFVPDRRYRGFPSRLPSPHRELEESHQPYNRSDG